MIFSSIPENVMGISAPRSIVMLDGYYVNFINWTVNLNSNHEADDFTITLPFKVTQNLSQNYLSATPDAASYLFQESNILVEVYVGYPPNPNFFQEAQLTRIMYGYMDTAELDFSNQSTKGETVIISGRNMMAPFLDNKSTVKYQNMTSSAIATMLGRKYGLNVIVSPTYTLAGTYFGGDTTAINKDSTEWDLIAFLANQEGFAARVFDDTLYFGPFEQIVGNVMTDGVTYTWGQNIRDLTLSRSPHAAKDITVEVHSFDTQKIAHVKAATTRKVVTKGKKATKKHPATPPTVKYIVTPAKTTYTSETKYIDVTAKSGASSSYSPTTYVQSYFYPNLTKDQAQKKAEAILQQLSQLEITGTMTVAGSDKLTVDRLLVLEGLGTGLSNNYYVRKATHNWDLTSDGYRCDLTFSNLLLMDDYSGGL